MHYNPLVRALLLCLQTGARVRCDGVGYRVTLPSSTCQLYAGDATDLLRLAEIFWVLHTVGLTAVAMAA